MPIRPRPGVDEEGARRSATSSGSRSRSPRPASRPASSRCSPAARSRWSRSPSSSPSSSPGPAPSTSSTRSRPPSTTPTSTASCSWSAASPTAPSSSSSPTRNGRWTPPTSSTGSAWAATASPRSSPAACRAKRRGRGRGDAEERRARQGRAASSFAVMPRARQARTRAMSPLPGSDRRAVAASEPRRPPRGQVMKLASPACLLKGNRTFRRGALAATLFGGRWEMTVAQRHMDRLTSFDTSFLANEKDNAHMAIGAVLVCAGRAAERGGLPHPHPQPRPPAAAPAPAPAPTRRLGLGTPFWVDHREFDIHRHVRRASLPAPGTEAAVPRPRRRAAGAAAGPLEARSGS